jgi:hypothetical protein
MLHFYVEDVDAVFKSAITPAAAVISEPADQFYGDRSGGCIEPSGNTSAQRNITGNRALMIYPHPLSE